MIGPYRVSGPSGYATIIDLATRLSAMGERTYVFLAVEGDDPEYPMLNGIEWIFFGNAYGSGADLARGDAHKTVTLLGMAMDGEWWNQEAVNNRRLGVHNIVQEIGKELG